jgi:hypothetical protein
VDLLGREVALLVDGEREAGEHTAVFDAEGRSSGVYIARLQTGGLLLTRRMSLVR